MGKVSDVVYPELRTTQKLSSDGSNFIIWKLKFAFVLTDHQFPHLISPSPADPTWDDQSPDALRLILRSLDENLRNEFRENHTPASIMEALLSRFSPTLKRFPAINLRRYMSCRMDPDTEINRHIFRMRAIAKELEYGAGIKIPDDVQATFLLNSLPEEWGKDVERLLRDLDGREEDLSFVNFSRRLRTLRDVKQLNNYIDSEKKRKRANGVCSSCGEQGHYMSDCPDQGSPKQEDFSVSFGPFGVPISEPTVTEIWYPDLKTNYRIGYNGPNSFTTWKLEISDVLEDIGVDYVLKEPEPSDPADSGSEEDALRYKKWHADDFTCRHLILGTMEDDVFLSFYDYPTAKSLMAAVEAFFNSASAAQKLVRLKRYMSHYMSDETPTMNHLRDTDVLLSKLRSSGMDIPSEMRSVVLMNSLPGSWDQIASALEMKLSTDKENGWSYDNVWKEVRDAGQFKELLEKNQADDSVSHDNAIDGRKNKRVLRGKCYSCGRSGHYQSHCPIS
ncbi:OLC1v1006287C1 [Oldenlandia corymbosa var. corymbosa]|uniref:OLC1v1006287C1 n=1 Tax=Oldenlandia corymbosa var. corymbosa TaxID=529605 RepID=A0AAV1DGM7_OLDCO|nr:OLC1v1006287C1 [Oldenlandia corymbosa var. corymbosa]